jgi:hypothetical protein
MVCVLTTSVLLERHTLSPQSPSLQALRMKAENKRTANGKEEIRMHRS